MVLTSKRLILYFNPRSHERSDCYSNISLTFSSYFNPRSHERSDATTLRQGIYRLNFNPRSHERSDWRTAEQAVAFFEISIHAPTRGATGKADMFTKRTIRFQSTLPREERQILILFNRFECLFQSTLPREERPTQPIIPMIHNNFNPRSHERSDQTADNNRPP